MSHADPPYVLPLGSPEARLDNAGGKAASLAELVRAGIPVPDGFTLCTSAYRAFVDGGALAGTIEAGRAEVSAAGSDQDAAATAARSVREAFDDATLPPAVATALRAAYEALPGEAPAVAVRSSATAEDLPDLSFAGQQETFLDVRGYDALEAAVKGCWASLWSPRAIDYRARNAVPEEGVAMAVVVQLLVPADSAGILFTANPVNGRRDQMVINASWGLGEAVVGGLVTPDTLVVERESGKVLARETARKTVMTVRGDRGSAEEAVPEHLQDEAVLDDAAAAELALLAARIEDHFGRPMDIEWARAVGFFSILQARPITALPEADAENAQDSSALLTDAAGWEPPVPGSAWIRRQVVEHMPEPLSPLFAELYLERGLERSLDKAMVWMGFDPDMMSSFIDRPFFSTVRGFAYMRIDMRFGPRSVAGIARGYVKALPRMLRGSIAYWRDQELPHYQAVIERWKGLEPTEAEDEKIIEGIEELAEADAVYWFAANFPLALSKVTDGLLERFVSSLRPRTVAAIRAAAFPDADATEAGDRLSSGPYLRGYPSITIDAQVALESVAETIRADEDLRARVMARPAGELVETLEGSAAGEAASAALSDYLGRYGHQIYNLDFAVPTQMEDPLPVLVALHGLATRAGGDARAQQAEFAAARERLSAATLEHLGPLRRPVARRLIRWAQRFAPYREDALYYVGAAWPTLRRLALTFGERLVGAGTLDSPDLVFFLRTPELREAAAARAIGEARPELGERAAERRALREARKALLPPPTVPVGYRMKMGPFDMSKAFQPKANVQEGDVLEGFPVSAGRVEAPASVILSPADFEKMKPGSILVCPTTTPAWTPLFAQARGLVTDIGGVLAHGSIVAREYGIPAVMGTTVATKRIRDGQMLRVDGTKGTVEVVGD